MIRALEGTADAFVGNISRAGWGYSFQNLLSDTFALLARCGVGCLFIGKTHWSSLPGPLITGKAFLP